MDFVQTTEQVDDRDLEPGEFEWRCKECGTRHPKNSPPCKKCGSMRFEKSPLRLNSSNPSVPRQRGQSVQSGSESESASGVPSSRRALLGYGVAAGAVLLGGGALIYDNDFANQEDDTSASVDNAESPSNNDAAANTSPTVDDVPGQADSASDIEFSTVEAMMRSQLNSSRSNSLTVKSETDDASTYYTRYLVKNGYESMDSDTLDQSFQEFGLQNWYAVRNKFTLESGRAIDYYESPGQLASDIIDGWREDPDIRNSLDSPEYRHYGADIHTATNGDVYVTVVLSD
ncbi:CAP domain-containing protein [Halocalculus aciditolerans]|uniref:RanBP2-type domain-containing protein n=1 Tax=Halocalculus aciditolerans TaxID=1383812 RepID=A0A830FI30_9EURY|nr:hypothetical protein [Halocalculus aciditolerans]GGL58012.1 hypothetical protein GCM10009039_15270 [Halocalculus aciditolerans]